MTNETAVERLEDAFSLGWDAHREGRNYYEARGEALAALSPSPAETDGIREAAHQLAIAAGALNVATDGRSELAPLRRDVLSALQAWERALATKDGDTHE